MGIYVPGTTETDSKKQNRSLQQLGAATEGAQSDIATAQANIATNTSNITTNTTNIATNTTAISALQAGPLTSGNVATKSNQQTGTSASLAVTPAHQQDHDSAVKAHASFTGSTGALLSGYGATVVRSSTGIFNVTWTVPFASTAYSVVLTSEINGFTTEGIFGIIETGTKSTTGCQIRFLNASITTTADPVIGHLVACGRQ